jgi:hypothetical protein
MRNRLHLLKNDERGMSLIFVGAGFLAFMATTTLAIDVGMFMTARSQAQNSADAGALAGAIGLVFNDYDDRSSTGPAVQGALSAASSNTVMHGNVSVTPADVTFPTGPTGVNNRVQVTVRRSAARGNPVPTLMARLLGVNTVDIMATATAEASPANAATCVMPFTIPDKWTEKQTGAWDPEDQFDLYDSNGRDLASPDIYVQGPGGTGYDAERDKGTLLRLKANNDNKTAPTLYNPWAIPGSTGADDYEENIFTCNTTIVEVGHLMTQEPGNMVGPTTHGMQSLVDRDPNAYWDRSCQCVMGSDYGKSPRVALIPLYDPVYYEEGKHNSRNADLKIANLLGFFIEEIQGNEVYGRITPTTALVSSNPSATPGSFAMAIRLVE